MRNHYLDMPAQLSSRAKGLYFDLNIHLHPYFEYASSEGSSEPSLLTYYALSEKISRTDWAQ